PFGYSAQTVGGRRRPCLRLVCRRTASSRLLRYPAFHLLVQRVAQVSTGHGSEISRGLEGISNTKCFCRVDKQLFEFVGDFLNENEAFHSQANLTCVMEPASDTSLDGGQLQTCVGRSPTVPAGYSGFARTIARALANARGAARVGGLRSATTRETPMSRV